MKNLEKREVRLHNKMR